MEKYIKSDTVLNFINGCLEHEDKITDIEKAVLIMEYKFYLMLFNAPFVKNHFGTNLITVPTVVQRWKE